MGMSTRYTTAAQIQKALSNNLVTVTNVKVESKDDHSVKTITENQFKTDLDFYVESGIFADSIDFKYELQGNNLIIYAGNMNPFCDSCITAYLSVKDSVTKEDLEKIIRKIEEL